MITVLMPLYNGGLYVRQAVESILQQSYRDFELLIIDDGSSDAGPEIVGSVDDARIVLLRNPQNMGVAATLNRGLEVARGHYIARMDADDISLPDRLEQQVLFMEAHPQVAISGGWVRLFGGNELPYTCRVPGDCRGVAAYMLFENPIWHMTVIMRRDAMHQASLRYNPAFSRSEDYDLWIRAVKCFSLANIERTLVRVRRHQGSATRANWDEVTMQTEALQGSLLQEMGLTVSPQEVSLHHRVGRGYRLETYEQVGQAEAWLLGLISANRLSLAYNDRSFRKVVGTVWYRVCSNSAPLGSWMWHACHSSPLMMDATIPMFERCRFMASIIWHMARRTKRRTL